MSYVANGLKSAALLAALVAASSTPYLVGKSNTAKEVNHPVIEDWFASETGNHILNSEATTSPIAKKAWTELSPAEKQIVVGHYKEQVRKDASTMLKNEA